MKGLFFLLFLLIHLGCFAQETYLFPSLSPKGEITQIVGNTALQIQYERPSVRKRKVFGGLVPFGKVWRTGAGQCTKIRFDKPVKIENQAVAAGTYSLFTIPDPDQWIVILNSDTTLYGSGFYDINKDVIRFIVIPTLSHRFYETLTIDIDLIPNDARIYISWENTQISFEVETTTDDLMDQYIAREIRSGKSQDSDSYAMAAEHMYFGRKDLLAALKMTDQAIALDSTNGWAQNVKIHILRDLHLFEQALQEIDKAYKQAQNREYETEAIKHNELKYWEALRLEIIGQH